MIQADEGRPKDEIRIPGREVPAGPAPGLLGPLLARLRRGLSGLRAFALASLDMIALPLVRCRLSPAGGSRPSVAVFALHGAGDLALALPCLEQIRVRYPKERYLLVLYCQPDAAELAERYVPADRIIQIDRHRMVRSLAYRLAALRAVAARRHAVALQPTFNRMLAVEDSLIRATAASERLGSGGSPAFMGPIARRIGNRWYHRLTSPSDRPMHELERYVEFLVSLGWSAPPGEPPFLVLPQTQAIEPAGYVLIVADSSNPLKSWPGARFERLAVALVERHGYRVVFAGRKRQMGLDRSLAAGPPGRVADRTGSTSLTEFLGLIRGARLVVTNDSGGLHFAVMLGRPTLAIAGGGLPDRYHPYPGWAGARLAVLERRLPCYGCNWNCIHRVSPGDPAPCIGGVEVDEVLAAIERHPALMPTNP